MSNAARSTTRSRQYIPMTPQASRMVVAYENQWLVKSWALGRYPKVATQVCQWSGHASRTIVFIKLLESFYDFPVIKIPVLNRR